MAPKIGPAVATLVALVVVLRKVLKSPAALRRFLGLEQVPPAELKFAPPNEAVPENVRGVWWIDAGPGVVTVDLNRLVPATSGEFYAQDAEPEYQTVSDDLTGLRLMLFATFCAVRSHVRVDADGPQVSWSLGRGALPLPLSSPSKRVDDIINCSGKTLASYFARRIIDAAGQKTEHLEAMLSRFSHVLQVRRAAPSSKL